MPELMINVSVTHLANAILAMNKQELETLSILLTNEGKELLQRKNTVEQNTVQLLTRDEAFDV